MTVPSTISYVTPQPAGNGVTNVFSFPFKILEASDIVSGLVDSTGLYYPKTNGADYTVQGVDQNNGGTITYAVAPAAGFTVDIRGVVPQTQPAAFTDQGKYLASSVEDAFDRLELQIQDLTRVSYTFGVHGPDTEIVPWPSLPGPAARANTNIGFDGNGNLSLTALLATTLTQSLFNAFLQSAPSGGQQTSAELAAGVTPTNLFYPVMCLERYGADPFDIVDSTTAFNAAFAVGLAIGNAMAFSFAGGIYKINGALFINTNCVGLEGRGCVLNATGFSGSNVYLLNFLQTASLTGSKRNAANLRHPLQNFTIQGPGIVAQATANCFLFNNVDSVNFCGGITIRNGASYDFNIHATYANGANFITFEDWQFDSSIPNVSFYGSNQFISIPATFNSSGVVNAGERDVWRRCRFGLCNTKFADVSLGAAQVTFDSGSADIVASQTAANFTFSNLSTLFTNGFRFEVLQRNGVLAITVPIISLTGASTKVTLTDAVLVLDIAYTVNDVAVFNCDSSVGNPVSGVTGGGGKLTLNNLQFLASVYPLPLVSSSGVVKINNWDDVSGATSGPNYISNSRSLTVDPSFNSGSLTSDGWVAAGGTVPTIDATNPYGGSAHDVQFTGTGTLTSRIFPASPGQVIFLEAQMAVTNYSAGTFTAVISWLNAAGSSIGGGGGQFAIGSLSANTAYSAGPYISQSSGGFYKAPPGTVGWQLTFSSTLSGGSKGYVGRVYADTV